MDDHTLSSSKKVVFDETGKLIAPDWMTESQKVEAQNAYDKELLVTSYTVVLSAEDFSMTRFSNSEVLFEFTNHTEKTKGTIIMSPLQFQVFADTINRVSIDNLTKALGGLEDGF